MSRHDEQPGTAVKCRRCGQLVVWVTTTNGKRMSCDVSPASSGKFYLFRKPDRIDAVHVASDDPRVARALARGQQAFNSHFSTCPMAAENREKRDRRRP